MGSQVNKEPGRKLFEKSINKGEKGMNNLDNASKEALQSMFKVLLEDLDTGEYTKEPGWRSSKELNIDLATKKTLIGLKLVQKNISDEIRLNFGNYTVRQQLKRDFEPQIKWNTF